MGSRNPSDQTKEVDPAKCKLDAFRGKKDQYERFNKQMQQYLLGCGVVYTQVYKGISFVVTDENCRARAADMHADLKKHKGPKDADLWKKSAGWATVEGQEAFIANAEQFVLETYQRVCLGGEAAEIIEGKTSAEVGGIFEEFRRRFASVEPEEIELQIKDLEACKMSDGSKVNNNSDVNKWATVMETKSQSIRSKLSIEQAGLESRIQLKALARLIMLNAPFHYKLHLEGKLEEKRLKSALFHTPVGGWTEELLDTFNKTVALDWGECKRHLNHFYRQQESATKESRNTPSMVMSSNGTERRCASCNSNDHLLSDCPRLNASLPYAPEDVKAKLLAKLQKQNDKRKRGAQPNTPWKKPEWKGKGSGGKGQGKGRGKGKGGDWYSSSGWNSGKGQGKGKGAPHGGTVSKPCFKFRDTGTCDWGAN